MTGYANRVARTLFWASTALIWGCVPAIAGPRVTVTQGTLAGRPDGMVNAFLGIPYAAAPVGDLRLKAPQAAPSWNGERDATEFGASCMQALLPEGRAPWTPEYMVQNRTSEDCLSLNVWTPALADARKPVLVWFHGGGFNEGAGSVPIYNGASLAGRNIVVVTVNYRLGALGFMAHPQITQEAQASGYPASNFGLQDQIAALKWVQKNIELLGGDPGNVTIAGQSAGAVAVHTLVSSPLAKGLFVRAIAQSGLPTILPMVALSEAEKQGKAFADGKGAKTLAQLRALPAEAFIQIAAAPGGMRFGPSVDGTLLPASPSALLEKGIFNDVAMLVGQTADEASAFPGYGNGDKDAYDAFLMRSFGRKALAFQSFYPAATETDRAQSMKQATRDRGLAMIDIWAEIRAAKGKSPIFAYYFTQTEPGDGAATFGAFHSSEIPYAFGTLDAAPERNFSLADRELSLKMSSYWVNFVKSGNPNGEGLVNWPAVTRSSVPALAFGPVIAAQEILPANKRSVYRAYVAQGGKLSMF